jgi:hypothetical protein
LHDVRKFYFAYGFCIHWMNNIKNPVWDIVF